MTDKFATVCENCGDVIEIECIQGGKGGHEVIKTIKKPSGNGIGGHGAQGDPATSVLASLTGHETPAPKLPEGQDVNDERIEEMAFMIRHYGNGDESKFTVGAINLKNNIVKTLNDLGWQRI